MTNATASTVARTRACIDVVIPVFDEAATLESVVLAVLAEPLVRVVIVVDDGSTDGTPEVLARLGRDQPRLRVLRHAVNRGKGAALRSGFAQASAPVVLVHDADAEYDARQIARVAAPILAGEADVVYGSRFQGRWRWHDWHAAGNAVLTALSNRCTGLRLTDMETGTKAFRREVLQRLRLTEDRFGIEPELTAKLARLEGVRWVEVAVTYARRGYGQGKKIGWRDGLDALRCIVRYGLFMR